MMETLNFKTQICTTIEQSKKLLELGLKKETADCIITQKVDGTFDVFNTNCGLLEVEIIKDASKLFVSFPAWSLHRLYKICPGCLFKLHPALQKIVTGDGIFYCTQNFNVSLGLSFSQHCNLYDNIIDCIERLIKNNYFNKDYLK